MFKAVIDRDGGCPWGATGLSTADWLLIPPSPVRIRDLIATQPGVYFQALTGPPTSHCGDPLPHVVCWRGDLYLEDGHHRTVRALLAGHGVIEARCYTIPED